MRTHSQPHHRRPRGSRTRAATLLLALAAFAATGCRSTYYKTMEGFGREKREILASRLEDAADVMQAARDELRVGRDELDAAGALRGDERRERERRYDRLRRATEGARRHADGLRDEVAGAERVGNDLFKEWREEAERLSDPALRASSAANLEATKERYLELVALLHRAQRALGAVIEPLEERTLAVKHALTAPADAAATLPPATQLDGDLRQVLTDLDAAIAEARSFRNSLEG